MTYAPLDSDYTRLCPECSDELDVYTGRDGSPYTFCLECGTAYDVEYDGDMDESGRLVDNTHLYLRYVANPTDDDMPRKSLK